MSTAMHSTFQRLTQTRRQHGTKAALLYLAARSFEKLLHLEVSELLFLDVKSLPLSVPIDSAFSFRFLTPAELTRFANDPMNELDDAFVRRAKVGYDLCFAALHEEHSSGEQLASYCWYALGSIEGKHHVGVPMSFPADMAYMYKAYTHPQFRGRRLYGVGVALALQALGNRGVSKLVTAINTSNFASLRSCRRMGFVQVGHIWTLGNGDHRWATITGAARQMGICFGNSAKIQTR